MRPLALSAALIVLAIPAMAEPLKAPPPVDGGPMQFKVFFPANLASLSPEGRVVVREAAAFALARQCSAAEVVGNTDAAAARERRLPLSERRARTVAVALIEEGFHHNMDLSWQGSAQPAVPRPEGVREPLNERVTIHFVCPPHP